MMIHRHQEGDFPSGDQYMTKRRDVTPYSDSTNPDDPLYVPVGEETTKKRGRPPKNNE